MWLVVLYGFAAVLALRTLLTLMQRHQRIHTIRLQREWKLQQAQAEEAALEAQIFNAIDQKNQELQQKSAA